KNGKPYQFFLNLPFGETFVEQNTFGPLDNQFKFNGKELDVETGLYYYGARFYDPRFSFWYGVDPLAEMYPDSSPYVYCANNPINLIDPDGQSWEPINKKGEVVKIDDYDNIHGYRWVDYDTDKDGNKVARENTVETAYVFGTKGMTTLSSEGYTANKSWQAYEDISTGSESTDKKIATLHPSIQNQMKSFILKAKYRYGIDLRVTDGFRSVEEQDKLYAKGRTAPGNIVTKARGGYSNHNFGLAVDVVPFENGKLNWETKKWDIIGRIGESRGLEWGGRWKFLDRPHFQNLFGKTLKELRALPKDANGLPIIK
ncbi:RHS repeat-associated core domain-containing protein, partial [Flavobacterium aurantiibacter]